MADAQRLVRRGEQRVARGLVLTIEVPILRTVERRRVSRLRATDRFDLPGAGKPRSRRGPVFGKCQLLHQRHLPIRQRNPQFGEVTDRGETCETDVVKLAVQLAHLRERHRCRHNQTQQHA